jgi:hypothetical protein
MGPRWRLAGFIVVLVCGCQSGRDLPPPPTDEPKATEKKDDVPFCGKVFADPKLSRRAACCVGPAAGILKGTDVASACGLAPAAYLGEAPDGAACRLYFRPASGDAHDSWVMVSHPMIPVGSPAPVRPDPMLPWQWKKVSLRDAIGYQAIEAHGEPGLLERQTILWAGRGRRILGLHVSKEVCNETQAQALLQRAIDAVP